MIDYLTVMIGHLRERNEVVLIVVDMTEPRAGMIGEMKGGMKGEMKGIPHTRTGIMHGMMPTGFKSY